MTNLGDDLEDIDWIDVEIINTDDEHRDDIDDPPFEIFLTTPSVGTKNSDEMVNLTPTSSATYPPQPSPRIEVIQLTMHINFIWQGINYNVKLFYFGLVWFLKFQLN